jgi:hypothetical protein
MKQKNNLSFTCKNCRSSGPAACSTDFSFLYCPWYTDYNQEAHDCIYCRHCGTVHDVVPSPWRALKRLLGRTPVKVVGAYRMPAIKRLTRIGNRHHPGLRTMHPFILEAMRQDGRLAADEDLTAEPTLEFLAECLNDSSPAVRREAAMALGRSGDEQAEALLEEAMEDEDWDVSESAEIALNRLKNHQPADRADESQGQAPDQSAATEQWQYFGYGRNRSSFDKIRRRRRNLKKLK